MIVNNSAIDIVSPPASRGADWIAGGFRFFSAAPLQWIVTTVLMLVATLVFRLGGDYLGTALSMLLTPVLTGGLMLGCARQEREGRFEISSLWSAFSGPHLGRLLTVGALQMLAMLLILGFVFAAIGGVALGTLFGGGSGDLESSAPALALFALLLALPCLFVMIAAFWLAPPLIVLRGAEPLVALSASLRASFKAIGSLTVYGLVSIVLIVVAMIPIGLGLLVVLPMIYASTYLLCRDVFPAPAATSPDADAQAVV